MARRSTCFGLSTIEILVVLGIFSLLLAMVFPVTNMVTEWARRGECANNLRQISHALVSYEEKHGYFPENLSVLYPVYLEDERVLSCPSRLIDDGDDYIYFAGRSLELLLPCHLVMDAGQNHGPRFSNILLTNQNITNSLTFRGDPYQCDSNI